MIEELYEVNLQEEAEALQFMSFSDILKTCRSMLGLKQYACADFLGMEHPRYKKLELGFFKDMPERWEVLRLETFFKLPKGLLQKKLETFLLDKERYRKTISKQKWNRDINTKGMREVNKT